MLLVAIPYELALVGLFQYVFLGRNKKGRNVMTQPAVVLIGADKGGVGKTTVARTLPTILLNTKFVPAHSTPKSPEAR